METKHLVIGYSGIIFLMDTIQIRSFNDQMEGYIEQLLPELTKIYKDIHQIPSCPCRKFGRQRSLQII